MKKLDVVFFRPTMYKGVFKRLSSLFVGINKYENCRWTDDMYDKCDVAVTTGGIKITNPRVFKTRKRLMERMPKKRLVWESSVFRQNQIEDLKYFRLGWNGFQYDNAIFNNANSPSDRWNEIQKLQNIRICDYQKTGSHILICMQKPNDASIYGLDMEKWALDVVNKLKEHTDRNIIIRPHPFDEDTSLYSFQKYFSKNKLLQDDLKNAWATITYNSLSSVESICQGIPTFTLHEGSLAWPVANHDLSKIESPEVFDRNQWLYDLAYTQWNLDEMRKGLSWLHLKPVYFS